ncbi:hypothetical protein [Streptomyces sp. NPDC002671]
MARATKLPTHQLPTGRREVPDELIKLERSAEEKRAKLAGLTGDEYDTQLRRWREASQAVQAAITAHAAAAEANRHEVAQAEKKYGQHREQRRAVASAASNGGLETAQIGQSLVPVPLGVRAVSASVR